MEVVKPVKLGLFGFIDKFILTSDKVLGTIQVYRTSKKHLMNFASITGKKEIQFDEIDADFYDNYIQYLNALNLAKNSVGKQIKVLKTFLHSSVDRGINTNTFFKTKFFKKPTEEVDKIFLTDDEIQRMYKLDLSGQGSIESVRDLFIIACYTGFRFSDFSTLEQSHITDSYITKKTLKTKTKVIIPIHPIVREILEKYNYILPKCIANTHANSHLKTIAEMAKVNADIEVIKTIGGKSDRKVYKKHELLCPHSQKIFCYKRFLGRGTSNINYAYNWACYRISVYEVYINRRVSQC